MDNKVRHEDAPDYQAARVETDRGGLNDDEIITEAIAILQRRLKERGVGPSFNSPNDSRDYFRLKITDLEHEEFHILFLDNQHKLLEQQAMFRGTIDGASVYPREVVKAALRLNAAAIICAHNHPSGNSEPSSADRQITDKLKTALGTVDIRILDHFIVGNEVYSFAEHGMI